MFRILAAIFMLNIVFLLTDGIYESGGGIQATALSADLTAVATTIGVVSTDGFSSDNKTISIGDEDIYYITNTALTFNNCVRGYNDTEATVHSAGDIVYDRGASLVNELMGYDITTTGTGAGASGEAEGSVVSTDESFWSDTIPKMFFWDYGFFNGQLEIFRYLLMGICGILTAIIAMNMLPFVNFG